MHGAHLPQRQRRRVVQRLLNLRNDRERDRSRRLRAKIEAGRCVHLCEPLLGAISRIRKSKQTCRLRRELRGFSVAAQARRDRRARNHLISSVARMRESCSKLCVSSTTASVALHIRRGTDDLIFRQGLELGMSELCLRCGEALARGEMAASIRNRREPTQLARQAQQRLRIVAGAKNPQTRPCCAIVDPNPRVVVRQSPLAGRATACAPVP